MQKHTAQCPRCNTHCPTGHSGLSLACAICNLIAVRHDHHLPFQLIIEAAIGIHLRGSSVRCNHGTLRVTGGATVRIDREMNIHVKGGDAVSVKRFNDVWVENCGGAVSVKRCRDVRLDGVGEVSLRRCNDVYVERGGDVFIKRCKDVHVEGEGAFGGGAVSARRCRNIRIAGGGKAEAIRCGVVQLAARNTGDLEMKRCKAVYVEGSCYQVKVN